MSLRKSPRRTPELLAAARNNAQHSTGPRSAAGKQNSKLNALKHGERANPENHREVMRALGEDPEEFDNLRQDLMTTYGPGGALWEEQIDDLAKLYWRRERLERAQEGLMRRALLAVEEWQHRRQQEMAGVTFEASHFEALELDLTEPDDAGVRLRMLLSFLGVIREQVRQRIYRPRQGSELKAIYGGYEGWRQARLRHLLWLFLERAKAERQEEPALHEFVSEYFEGGEAAVETHYQELLRLLDEEIAYVEEEFRHAEKVNEEKAAIERDAALAPAGEVWTQMVRQQAALDRSIDRKVRILLAMRKEFLAGKLPSNAGNAEDQASVFAEDETVECGGGRHSHDELAPSLPRNGDPCHSARTQTAAYAAGATACENTKMNERSGNVIGDNGPLWRTAEAGWNSLEHSAA
jgi:hypothetical protein